MVIKSFTLSRLISHTYSQTVVPALEQKSQPAWESVSYRPAVLRPAPYLWVPGSSDWSGCSLSWVEDSGSSILSNMHYKGNPQKLPENWWMCNTLSEGVCVGAGKTSCQAIAAPAGNPFPCQIIRTFHLLSLSVVQGEDSQFYGAQCHYNSTSL